MTTKNHPITPPPKLVQQWIGEHYGSVCIAPGEATSHVATQAARWGADQELEACCADIHTVYGKGQADWLRSMRRPKPPSLKEQALARLTSLEELAESMGHSPDDTIRRALEALPE